MMDEVKMTNEMAVVSGPSFIEELQSEKSSIFTTLKATTMEEKANLFNAMNNPDKRISDMIGQIINVKDVFAEEIEIVNKETGEVNRAPRIVVIDTDGVSYQAVSVGVMSALKKLFGIFGLPTWEEGIPLQVKQVKNGINNILTFAVAK